MEDVLVASLRLPEYLLCTLVDTWIGVSDFAARCQIVGWQAAFVRLFTFLVLLPFASLWALSTWLFSLVLVAGPKAFSVGWTVVVLTCSDLGACHWNAVAQGLRAGYFVGPGVAWHCRGTMADFASSTWTNILAHL